MPKMTRTAGSGKARKSPAKKTAAKKTPARKGAARRRAPARSGPLTALRNRLSARLRGAGYRVSNAARLVSVVCAFLIVGGIVFLSGLGRMQPAMDSAGRAVDSALRDAGFALAAIDVAGARNADPAAIRDALGADPARSIFRVDLDAARQRVEAVDWVDRAAVLRLLPGRIHVVVTEQVPVARWQIDGEILVIDVKGAPIDRAAADAHGALPLVVGEGAAEPAPSLIAALDQFPAVGGRVEAAQRVGQRRWTLFLEGGAEILLPEGEAEPALAILNDLQLRRGLLDAPAETIDLRNPDQLVVTPANPADAPDASAAAPEGREA